MLSSLVSCPPRSVSRTARGHSKTPLRTLKDRAKAIILRCCRRRRPVASSFSALRVVVRTRDGRGDGPGIARDTERPHGGATNDSRPVTTPATGQYTYYRVMAASKLPGWGGSGAGRGGDERGHQGWGASVGGTERVKINTVEKFKPSQNRKGSSHRLNNTQLNTETVSEGRTKLQDEFEINRPNAGRRGVGSRARRLRREGVGTRVTPQIRSGKNSK
ncbi:hypothetical protein AAG570_005462 [Ranatra chinensis]|uniref:Uncharacterized protein n=1 Tax=Ranatra chinensis TaxID=642074 RepID=A0ABD0XXI4_9HEMI